MGDRNICIFILESVDNPRFPFRLTLRKGDELLLALRVQDRWPGQKGNIFCIREENGEWEPPDEEIERVPVVSLRRYGKRLSLVLDRSRNKRCDLLFLKKRYKNREGEYEQIFWRTQQGLRQNRPRVKLTTYRHGELDIIIDSGEKYPWKFPTCNTSREKLPVGDYALAGGNGLDAVIERKTFTNLVAEFARIAVFHQQLGELASYRNSALVIEANYSDFLNPTKLDYYKPAFAGKALGELFAYHSGLSIIFAGNRKLANEWALRFFAAVSAHGTDTPHLKVADVMEQYGETPEARGGVFYEIRELVTSGMPERFTFAMVRDAVPHAPDHAIRRALNDLRSEGSLTSGGRGRGSYWEKR